MDYLTKQYAVALYDTLVEDGNLDECSYEFYQVCKAFDGEVMKFFNHPKISKEAKKEVIASFVKCDSVYKFLCVLIDNTRFKLVFKIKKALKNLINDLHNIVKIKVYSKVALTDKQTTDLQVILEKKYNKKVVILQRIDENIVAGIRVKCAGQIFNNTINNEINALKLNLLNGEVKA